MNTPNLFVDLFKYRPRENLTSKENFLTESVAYLLKTDLRVRYAWLSRVLNNLDSPTQIKDFSVTTQEFLKPTGDDGRSFYDLVVRFKFNGRKTIRRVEHKWGASAEEPQLKKYLQQCGSHSNLVFFGASKEQCKVASGFTKKSFLWEALYTELAKIKTPTRTLAEFLEFLRVQGLGPVEPLTPAILRSDNRSMLETLEAYAARLTSEASFSWRLIPSAYRRGGQDLEWSKRWGRAAVEFHRKQEWDPCITLGFLYNGTDHKVRLIEPQSGPDLMLRIEGSKRQYPNQKPVLETIEAKAAVLRKSGATVFVKGQTKGPNNPRTLLLTRNCLADVVAGRTSTDGQLKAVYETLNSWCAVLFADGCLEKRLRECFHIP